MSLSLVHPGKRMLLLFLTFQIIFDATFANDNPFWCAKKQKEAVDVVSWQRLSRRFELKNLVLIDSQSLVWTKGETMMVKWQNHSLEYHHGSDDDDTRRYMLNKINDTTYDLSIENMEENDSGHHVLTINQGLVSFCIAYIINLTVENQDNQTPKCFTQLSQKGRKLQMSCQWVQVNVGDRAQLVAGNQVVYEYNAPEFHVNGNFTLTNQFSVYVDPEFIFEENIMPTTCVVSHIRRRRNKTCTFPPVEQHAIQDNIQKSVTFECCVPNYSFPLSWWFNDSGNLQIVNYTESYIVTGDRHGNVVFFCSQEDDFSTIKVLSIGQINLPGYQYCISFSSGSDRTHPNNSTDELRCETLIVNVTMTESTSPSYDTVTQENVSSSNCVVSKVMNATTNPKYKKKPFSMETMLITVLVLSTIAHGVSIVAFIFSYRNDGKYDVSKHD